MFIVLLMNYEKISLFLQIASAWLMCDNILSNIRKISYSNSLYDNLLSVEKLLNNVESRRCLLIENDEDQFHGQQSRLNNWEFLNPIQENSALGNFQTLGVIFKSERGKGITNKICLPLKCFPVINNWVMCSFKFVF